MRYSVLTLILSLLIFSCSDQVVERHYPIIATTTITDISTEGISIESTIGGDTNDEIIDHGFRWNSYSISLGPLNSNSFSAKIDNFLYPGRTYSIRAFIKTKNYEAIGKSLSFKSQGSVGFTVDNVSPVLFNPGDTLTIAGKRFGVDKSKISVNLRVLAISTTLAEILSLTDTEIKIKAPVVYFGLAQIIVTNSDVGEKIAPTIIRKRGPTIISVSSPNICSPIVISGADFLYLGQPKSIYLGEVLIENAVVTDDKITIPSRYHVASLDIKIKYTSVTSEATIKDPASRNCN